MRKERWKRTSVLKTYSAEKMVNTRFFQSREMRITHHSMEARLHRRREGIGISTSHSVTLELDAKFEREKGETTHHQECLHLIFQLALCVANIQDGSVPARLNAAVLLDCLEYLPAIVAIAYISCQSESNEEGFNSFWSVGQVSRFRGTKFKRRTSRYNEHHMKGYPEICNKEEV